MLAYAPYALVVLDAARDGYILFSLFSLSKHTCANNVDPDETARHEPSHRNLHFFCLLFYFLINTETPKWTCPKSRMAKPSEM